MDLSPLLKVEVNTLHEIMILLTCNYLLIIEKEKHIAYICFEKLNPLLSLIKMTTNRNLYL